MEEEEEEEEESKKEEKRRFSTLTTLDNDFSCSSQTNFGSKMNAFFFLVFFLRVISFFLFCPPLILM